MAKRDYNKAYKESNTEPVETTEVTETVENEVTDATENVSASIETTEVKKTFGIVDNCKRLNVRKNPNIKAEVLFVLDAGATVEINKELSKGNFYSITYNNKTGFCMKDFITIKS